MRQEPHDLMNWHEFSERIHCVGFSLFCKQVEASFQVTPTFEFSRCSWEYGWNLKYKKSGKTLCTIYPREHYFTVMVVLNCTDPSLSDKIPTSLKDLFHQTQEGNHQRWMMIDLEEEGTLMQDVIALIQLRHSMQQNKTIR